MNIETEALRMMVSELNEALVEAKRERDTACRERDSGAGKILTYAEATGGGDFDELCSMCHESVAEPHTWVECLRKLAAHRDHLLGFAATLEHERDHARRQVKLLRRLLERSRTSKADLRTLLEFARSERDKAEEELRALEPRRSTMTEWLTCKGCGAPLSESNEGWEDVNVFCKGCSGTGQIEVVDKVEERDE